MAKTPRKPGQVSSSEISEFNTAPNPKATGQQNLERAMREAQQQAAPKPAQPSTSTAAAPKPETTPAAPTEPQAPPKSDKKEPGAFSSAASAVGSAFFDAAFPGLAKFRKSPTDTSAAGSKDNDAGGGMSRGINEVKYSVNRVAEQVGIGNQLLNTMVSHQMETNNLLAQILKKGGMGGGQEKNKSLLESVADAVGTAAEYGGTAKSVGKSLVSGAKTVGRGALNVGRSGLTALGGGSALTGGVIAGGGLAAHYLDKDENAAGNSSVGSWVNENIPGAAGVDDWMHKATGGWVGTSMEDPRYSWNKKDAEKKKGQTWIGKKFEDMTDFSRGTSGTLEGQNIDKRVREIMKEKGVDYNKAQDMARAEISGKDRTAFTAGTIQLSSQRNMEMKSYSRDKDYSKATETPTYDAMGNYTGPDIKTEYEKAGRSAESVNKSGTVQKKVDPTFGSEFLGSLLSKEGLQTGSFMGTQHKQKQFTGKDGEEENSMELDDILGIRTSGGIFGADTYDVHYKQRSLKVSKSEYMRMQQYIADNEPERAMALFNEIEARQNKSGSGVSEAVKEAINRKPEKLPVSGAGEPAPPSSGGEATPPSGGVGGATATGGGGGGGMPMPSVDAMGNVTGPSAAPAPSAAGGGPAGGGAGGAGVTPPMTGGAGAPDKTGENGKIPDSMLAPVGIGGHKAQPAAASAFKSMREAAKNDKVDLGITDSYRSYAAQVDVKRRKPSLAATPGKSNHGWGLAFDMSFGSNTRSPGYQWMTANASKFGFKGPLQRPNEPWHWEYVGGGAGAAAAGMEASKSSNESGSSGSSAKGGAGEGSAPAAAAGSATGNAGGSNAAGGGTGGGQGGGGGAGGPGGGGGGTAGGMESGSGSAQGGEKVSGGAGIGSGLAAVGLKEGSTTSTNQNKELFQKAMNDSKIQDPQMRAAMAAVAEGESGFKMGAEKSYAGTSNDRIRSIFKSKTNRMNDAELTELKKNPEKFFNHVYGGQLGNAKDEGYKFRGRGFIQLTGKGNYEKYGKMAGVDLVKNPELLDDPAIAARVSVEYMKDRTKKGGGDIYDRVARGVGNPVASTEAVKRQAYARNTQSGTFAPGREANLEGIQMAQAEPTNKAALSGNEQKTLAAQMQPAAPAGGARLDAASRKDAVDERSSRQAIAQNQSSDSSGSKSGSPSKGKEDIDAGSPGNVEPPSSRARFAELYEMGSTFAG